MSESFIYEAPPGPNEWERQMLYLADTDGVLAACMQAAVQSMQWTCEQAGHPKQEPDNGRCICETWSGIMLDGALIIDCG